MRTTQAVFNPGSSILVDLSNELASVSARVLTSLVQVRRDDGGAAGTVWHPDGLILTNAHVVAGRHWPRGRRPAGSGDLRVVLPSGDELAARVLAVDDKNDLAALRVEAAGLPTVALADSRRLQPGDIVIALGFPWGVTGGATTGIVIGTGAALPELASSGREWIAASLHLRPGHSGGPMVDAHGRLVGINTLMNGPDVGVAVPVHVVVDFLKQQLVQQV